MCSVASPLCRVVGEREAVALRTRLREAGLSTEVLSGETALCEVASHPDVDVVMGAIVGAPA